MIGRLARLVEQEGMRARKARPPFRNYSHVIIAAYPNYRLLQEDESVESFLFSIGTQLTFSFVTLTKILKILTNSQTSLDSTIRNIIYWRHDKVSAYCSPSYISTWNILLLFRRNGAINSRFDYFQQAKSKGKTEATKGKEKEKKGTTQARTTTTATTRGYT